jgi:hypothetical protein
LNRRLGRHRCRSTSAPLRECGFKHVSVFDTAFHLDKAEPFADAFLTCRGSHLRETNRCGRDICREIARPLASPASPRCGTVMSAALMFSSPSLSNGLAPLHRKAITPRRPFPRWMWTTVPSISVCVTQLYLSRRADRLVVLGVERV